MHSDGGPPSLPSPFTLAACPPAAREEDPLPMQPAAAPLANGNLKQLACHANEETIASLAAKVKASPAASGAAYRVAAAASACYQPFAHASVAVLFAIRVLNSPPWGQVCLPEGHPLAAPGSKPARTRHGPIFPILPAPAVSGGSPGGAGRAPAGGHAERGRQFIQRRVATEAAGVRHALPERPPPQRLRPGALGWDTDCRFLHATLRYGVSMCNPPWRVGEQPPQLHAPAFHKGLAYEHASPLGPCAEILHARLPDKAAMDERIVLVVFKMPRIQLWTSEDQW